MVKCCGPSKHSARDLRETVAFERKTRTSDGAGGFVSGWTAVSGAPTRAKVVAVSGSERFQSDRVEASTRFRIVVRYFSGLLDSDSIVHRGRRYNIRFINNVDFMDDWLELSVDGGVAV